MPHIHFQLTCSLIAKNLWPRVFSCFSKSYLSRNFLPQQRQLGASLVWVTSCLNKLFLCANLWPQWWPFSFTKLQLYGLSPVSTRNVLSDKPEMLSVLVTFCTTVASFSWGGGQCLRWVLNFWILSLPVNSSWQTSQTDLILLFFFSKTSSTGPLHCLMWRW